MTNTNTNTSRRTTARKAGAVRTVTVAPESLAGVDLGAASLPPELMAALTAAQSERKATAPRIKRARCKVPANVANIIETLGWEFYCDAVKTFEPNNKLRANYTANSDLYLAVGALLKSRNVTVWELAQLYNHTRNAEKNILRADYILQRVANRLGCAVTMRADIISIG